MKSENRSYTRFDILEINPVLFGNISSLKGEDSVMFPRIYFKVSVIEFSRESPVALLSFEPSSLTASS